MVSFSHNSDRAQGYTALRGATASSTVEQVERNKEVSSSVPKKLAQRNFNLAQESIKREADDDLKKKQV